jgi:hypothetical protein
VLATTPSEKSDSLRQYSIRLDFISSDRRRSSPRQREGTPAFPGDTAPSTWSTMPSAPPSALPSPARLAGGFAMATFPSTRAGSARLVITQPTTPRRCKVASRPLSACMVRATSALANNLDNRGVYDNHSRFWRACAILHDSSTLAKACKWVAPRRHRRASSPLIL